MHATMKGRGETQPLHIAPSLTYILLPATGCTGCLISTSKNVCLCDLLCPNGCRICSVLIGTYVKKVAKRSGANSSELSTWYFYAMDASRVLSTVHPSMFGSAVCVRAVAPYIRRDLRTGAITALPCSFHHTCIAPQVRQITQGLHNASLLVDDIQDSRHACTMMIHPSAHTHK